MSGGVSSLFSSSEIKAVVGQLQNQIAAPIKVEQAQIKSDTTQISALGAIRGALSSLNGTLSGIADPASINPMQATVGTSTVASAKAGASAAAGSYDLTGIKLAKPQEVYSKTYASASAKVGSGSGSLKFTFAGGATASISIPSSADTLSGVAAAINKAGKGVSASVVNTASGAQLVLKSTSSGSKQGFTVSGTGAESGLSYSASGGTLTLAQAARNATFNLNGVPVSEATNNGITLTRGLSLSLKSSGSTSISVASSPKSLSSALSTFTNSLNKAVSEIARQTEYKPASASASASGSKKAKTGPLLGNVQVQQLKQTLLSAISSAYSSGIAAASLGFSISSGGSVKFSSSTFAAAYQKNPTAVNKLVASIETNLKGVVSGAIGTSSGASSAGSASGTAASGFVGAAKTDLQGTNKSLNAQIKSQETLGNEQITNLENQFTNAINATSGSGSTLSYLSLLTGASTKSGSGG